MIVMDVYSRKESTVFDLGCECRRLFAGTGEVSLGQFKCDCLRCICRGFGWSFVFGFFFFIFIFIGGIRDLEIGIFDLTSLMVRVIGTRIWNIRVLSSRASNRFSDIPKLVYATRRK